MFGRKKAKISLEQFQKLELRELYLSKEIRRISQEMEVKLPFPGNGDTSINISINGSVPIGNWGAVSCDNGVQLIDCRFEMSGQSAVSTIKQLRQMFYGDKLQRIKDELANIQDILSSIY